MSNAELLKTFVSAYTAQPATAYWRAIEVGAIARYGLPQGLGLDLGCGDGILTGILLEAVGPRRLVGIDLDPQEIEAARKFPFYERLHAAPATAIPEADGTFDFVLSNSVLEHIPDLESTIAEVSRVLRPGGKYVFTVPAPALHDNLSGPVMPNVSRATYIENLDRRIAHIHYLSVTQWRQMSEAHGLTLDDCLGFIDAQQTRRWENLSRVTGGALYWLFGERKSPIEIQRTLGLRAMQNRGRAPSALAGMVSNIVALGAPVDTHAEEWLEPETASGFLVVGHKK
jgi:SAM-dependent methyltransferase